MHQIQFWYGFAPDPLGELRVLPRPSSWILGAIILRTERGGKRGNEGRGVRRNEKGNTELVTAFS